MVSDVAPFNPYSILHIPLYGILTLLLILSFPPQRRRFVNPMNSKDSINPSNPVVPGIIGFIVAIADEIHQAYLPNRNASVIDVLLDLAGIICCILLIRRFQPRSVFSKVKDFLRGIT